MWTPYLLETRYELTRLLRLPAYTIPTLAFPVMFYLLFGIALSGSRAMGGRDLATYLLGSYGAFGVIGAALFGFGVSVATERAQGWFLLKRATPMPPLVYVAGKAGASVAFSVLVVVGLAVCAVAFGSVDLPSTQWLALSGTLVLGCVPFCAIGLALGFIVGPNSAPAIVNLVHLPASLAAGLWIPLEALPRPFQVIGPMLPHYHLGQLALAATHQSSAPEPAWNLAILAAWTVAGIAAAVVTFRRDEGRLYG